MSDKKTIIKDFQSMKPSVAFKQLDFSSMEIHDCMKIAIRWGNKAFGSKLSDQTLKHLQEKLINSVLNFYKTKSTQFHIVINNPGSSASSALTSLFASFSAA